MNTTASFGMQNPSPSAPIGGLQPEKHQSADTAVCTVISKNYLSFARVFAKSLLKYQPDVKVFVLLVDKIDGYFDPAKEPFELILMEELDNVPNPAHLFFKYTVLELNTAIKPYFFAYLFSAYRIRKLVYFDPDILILHSLDTIWSLLDQHAIVLTPHLTASIEDGSTPGEMDILRAGIYNLGFIAMADTRPTHEFLQWWQKRLYNFCIMEPDKDLHVDQRWVDLAPGLFEGVYILRSPEYNVAYWNLHSRAQGIRIDGADVTMNGAPLRFFHFSGFYPDQIDQISKHQDRFTLNDLPNLRPLFERYRDLLLAEGYHQVRHWSYAYDYFDNGARIQELARKLYRRLGDRALRFGDPFATHGSSSFFAWSQSKIKLHSRLVLPARRLLRILLEPLFKNHKKVLNRLKSIRRRVDERFLHL